MSCSEENWSEYFLAIQKVLHDIAAKLTNTHRLTCHNAAETRGQTLLPAKKVSTTADGDVGEDRLDFSLLDEALDDLCESVNPNDVHNLGWERPPDGESTPPLEKNQLVQKGID